MDNTKVPLELLEYYKKKAASEAGVQAEELATFIGDAQVQFSRLQSFVRKNDVDDGFLGRINLKERHLYMYFYDAYKIEAWCDRLFDFARSESEFISDFCDKNNAIRAVLKRIQSDDEGLSNYIEKRWPV